MSEADVGGASSARALALGLVSTLGRTVGCGIGFVMEIACGAINEGSSGGGLGEQTCGSSRENDARHCATVSPPR